MIIFLNNNVMVCGHTFITKILHPSSLHISKQTLNKCLLACCLSYRCIYSIKDVLRPIAQKVSRYEQHSKVDDAIINVDSIHAKYNIYSIEASVYSYSIQCSQFNSIWVQGLERAYLIKLLLI